MDMLGHGTIAVQATNKRGEQMKNNIFSKTFFVTVLLMALVGLVSCNNNAELKKENAAQEGIVVTGSFTFDGMTAGDTSTGRSAAPSFAEYDPDDYYCVVQAYGWSALMGSIGGGVKPNGGGDGGKPEGDPEPDPDPQPQFQKIDEPCASGTGNVANKTWNIYLPCSGYYSIEVTLVKNGDDEDNAILIGESPMIEVVLDENTISSHLNSTIAWSGEPVRLLPNPKYTNEEKTVSVYVSGSYKSRVRKYAEVPVVLNFRYPTASNITAIYSHVYSFPFTYDSNDTTYNDVTCVPTLNGDNGEITEVCISGTKELNGVTEKDDWHNFPAPDPYNGSDEGIIEFKDASGKVVYSCNETITLIPGFTTDTWYWEDENDPHYYKDSNGVTYFNITQEMLDEYKEIETYKMDTAWDTANHEYPVVLFDKSSSNYGYSVVKNFPKADATLNDGLALASGRTVLDFAIAPIDSNTRISNSNTNIVYTLTNNYDTTEQQIFTAERNASNNIVIVKYPTYNGYTDGEVVALLENTTNTDVLSMYAAYDGYIYLLLGRKGSYKEATMTTVSGIKRVCVKQNTKGSRDELFGLVQDIVFNDGTNDVDFVSAIHENVPSGNTVFYKLAAYNYGSSDNYIYVSYVDNSEYLNGKLYCDRIAIPTDYDDEPTITINTSAITHFYMTLAKITGINQTSQVFEYTYVSDAIIIPEKSSGAQQANMYLLLHAPVEGGTTYGGILKVGYITEATWNSEDRYLPINKLDPSNENESYKYIRGWYIGYDYPFANETNYLYGPTKFVARKPDELVIADEKSYKIDSEHGNNEDRVVFIQNLQNFADPNVNLITSATAVSTKFSWEIQVSCYETDFII